MNNEKITHIDLFSGIGGFALAADRVFGNVEHIFCDNDSFCAEVLKKHWPDAPIFGDIRTLTHSECVGLERGGHLGDVEAEKQSVGRSTTFTIKNSSKKYGQPFILTGGFPCQPFSQAGRRRGEEDDRFLWPEMLRVIREFSPLWVIAENVRGLLTQGGGVVFERVCTDLEAAGYEVQPIIIPAVAVGAPHRRDRVWFVAHRNDTGSGTSERETFSYRTESSEEWKDALTRLDGQSGNDTNAERTRLERGVESETARAKPSKHSANDSNAPNTRREPSYNTQDKQELESERSYKFRIEQSRDNGWGTPWLEVATRLCRVDDGLPRRMDRNPRLKALGNAIVPQVAEEIMGAIKSSPLL